MSLVALTSRTLFSWKSPVLRSTLNNSRSSQRRWYTLSRFEQRNPGVGRHRSKLIPKVGTTQEAGHTAQGGSALNKSISMEDNLRRLLFQDNTLVVERQVEMLNVFIGFEQSNKYIISSEQGEPLGYIAEDPKGFFGTLSRQFLATHRPFRAVIMDTQGNPLLFLRRPFAWINSRMFVQRIRNSSELELDAEPTRDIFGEAQQIWHPWRRRYDLFLREHTVSAQQSHEELENAESIYNQIAKVDAGFFAWHFHLLDQGGNEIASIDRAFRGIGREILTDTGRYSVHFGLRESPGNSTSKNDHARELNLNERALFLALAVNIDFDYFSRHSRVGGGGIFHFASWD